MVFAVNSMIWRYDQAGSICLGDRSTEIARDCQCVFYLDDVASFPVLNAELRLSCNGFD